MLGPIHALLYVVGRLPLQTMLGILYCPWLPWQLPWHLSAAVAQCMMLQKIQTGELLLAHVSPNEFTDDFKICCSWYLTERQVLEQRQLQIERFPIRTRLITSFTVIHC